MRLTFGQLHELYLGMAALEREGITLAGETRLAMAVNINLIKPQASAYEITRTKSFAEIQRKASAAEPPKSDLALQAELLDAGGKLAAAEAGDFALHTITDAALKLDENATLSGSVLAQLIPVRSDVAKSDAPKKKG